MHHIDLSSVLRQTLACDLYSNLVTRPTGAAVRTQIELLLGDPDATTRALTIIDFSQVSMIDFSCADEVVAKLLMRYVVRRRAARRLLPLPRRQRRPLGRDRSRARATRPRARGRERRRRARRRRADRRRAEHVGGRLSSRDRERRTTSRSPPAATRRTCAARSIRCAAAAS